MRVLVVEDDPVLAKMVGVGLRREGLAVDVVLTGVDAQDRLTVDEYDVLVLDRDLPGVSGDVICAQVVKSEVRTRILMLTAATGLGERVGGLRLGADDYLCKPFEFPELVARVFALARRAAPAYPPQLERNGLRLDPSGHIATRDGRDLNLTPKEFTVLRLLLEAQGKVVSAEELLERGWDQHTDPFTGAIRVVMSKLRSKLGSPDLIRTVSRTGYQIP